MNHQHRPDDLGTPERHTHTDDEGNPILRSEETAIAGVRRARVTDNLTRMKERGQIGEREYNAAVKLRDSYEVYCLSMPSPAYDGVPPPDSYSSRSPSQRAMEAGAEYRLTMDRVPAHFRDVLHAVVCYDMTLTGYALGVRKHRQYAKGWFDAALKCLVAAGSS